MPKLSRGSHGLMVKWQMEALVTNLWKQIYENWISLWPSLEGLGETQRLHRTGHIEWYSTLIKDTFYLFYKSLKIKKSIKNKYIRYDYKSMKLFRISKIFLYMDYSFGRFKSALVMNWQEMQCCLANLWKQIFEIANKGSGYKSMKTEFLFDLHWRVWGKHKGSTELGILSGILHLLKTHFTYSTNLWKLKNLSKITI